MKSSRPSASAPDETPRAKAPARASAGRDSSFMKLISWSPEDATAHAVRAPIVGSPVRPLHAKKYFRTKYAGPLEADQARRFGFHSAFRRDRRRPRPGRSRRNAEWK